MMSSTLVKVAAGEVGDLLFEPQFNMDEVRVYKNAERGTMYLDTVSPTKTFTMTSIQDIVMEILVGGPITLTVTTGAGNFELDVESPFVLRGLGATSVQVARATGVTVNTTVRYLVGGD